MVAISKIAIAATSFVGYALAISPMDAAASQLTLFHELKAVPSQWVSKSQAHADTPMKMQIGLKQSNIDGLQAKLMDVSNPESANYGKWLSKDEVAKYTAPAAGHVEAVKAWLAAHGITQTAQPTNE